MHSFVFSHCRSWIGSHLLSVSDSPTMSHLFPFPKFPNQVRHKTFEETFSLKGLKKSKLNFPLKFIVIIIMGEESSSTILFSWTILKTFLVIYKKKLVSCLLAKCDSRHITILKETTYSKHRIGKDHIGYIMQYSCSDEGLSQLT